MLEIESPTTNGKENMRNIFKKPPFNLEYNKYIYIENQDSTKLRLL